MSSKGTRITPVRIDPVLLEDVQSQIRSRNEHTKDEEWNLSDFIRVALAEKLKHYRRSRKKKSKSQAMCRKVINVELACLFTLEYDQLAKRGKADDVGGREFWRVCSNWFSVGCPWPIAPFIERLTNQKETKRQGHGQKREEWETLSEG
jgi:hypothetical protein